MLLCKKFNVHNYRIDSSIRANDMTAVAGMTSDAFMVSVLPVLNIKHVVIVANQAFFLAMSMI